MAIDIYRKKTSEKREGTTYALSLSELEDCVSGNDNPQKKIETKMLTQTLNKYIQSLPQEFRNVFVCRYYFMDSIKDIAGFCNCSESRIKSILFRTRENLRGFLTKEGFEV